MKNIISYLILVVALSGVACGTYSTSLCVSERISAKYYLAVDKESGLKGLWVLKHAYNGDSTRNVAPNAGWTLIFEDIEKVGSSTEFLIGERSGHRKRYMIMSGLNGAQPKLHYYSDSASFTKARLDFKVPEGVTLKNVSYLGDAPCVSDTVNVR